MEETQSTSLARRAVALLVLAIAGFILLKFVIHAVIWLATTLVIVAAVIGVIWALRTL